MDNYCILEIFKVQKFSRMASFEKFHGQIFDSYLLCTCVYIYNYIYFKFQGAKFKEIHKTVKILYSKNFPVNAKLG